MIGSYIGLRLHTCNDPHGIYRDVARRMIEVNAFNSIIDVRTQNEWNKGHHPLAIHIPIAPMKEFIKNVSRLDRESNYLIYCRTGTRAKVAWKEMKKLGFKKVYFFIGGTNELI